MAFFSTTFAGLLDEFGPKTGEIGAIFDAISYDCDICQQTNGRAWGTVLTSSGGAPLLAPALECKEFVRKCTVFVRFVYGFAPKSMEKCPIEALLGRRRAPGKPCRTRGSRLFSRRKRRARLRELRAALFFRIKMPGPGPAQGDVPVTESYASPA